MSGVTDVHLAASLPFASKNGMKFTPSVGYYYIVDGDLADTVAGGGEDRDHWVFGFTASSKF